jgi:hypothetical protein
MLADSTTSLFTLAPKIWREQDQVTWTSLALVTDAGL